jgi:hypothetical protein
MLRHLSDRFGRLADKGRHPPLLVTIEMDDGGRSNEDIMFTEINPTPNRGGRLFRPPPIAAA